MLTAVETVRLVTGRKLKAADALEERLKLIKEKDGAIGAFLEIFEESARAGLKIGVDKLADAVK